MLEKPADPQTISDLRTPPQGLEVLPPPIQPTQSHLPWDGYDWKNFERLCLRLLEAEFDVEEPRLYGTPGEDQQGIDMLAKRKDSAKYVVCQAKRVQSFSPSEIHEVRDEFLHIDPKTGAALPAPKDDLDQDLPLPRELADTFILALTQRLSTSRQNLAWTTLQTALSAIGVKAILWDHDGVEKRLRKHPEIVDEFFGRAWVSAFCGAHAAAKLDSTAGAADRQAVTLLIQEFQTNGLMLSPESISDIVRAVQSTSTLISPAEPPVAQQDGVDRELERLRMLAEAGAHQAALEGLAALEVSLDGEHGQPKQRSTLLRVRGNLLYRQGKPFEAAKEFHRAYEQDPTSASSQCLKGLAFLIEEEPQRALGYLDQVCRTDPGRTDARFLYAMALAQTGDTTAIQNLETELTADDGDLAINLARHYSNQQDPIAVRRILNRLDGGPFQDDPQKQLLEAKVTLQEVMDQVKGMHGSLRSKVLEQHKGLQNLIDTITKILPSLRDPRQIQHLVPEALNVRQVAYSLLGQEEQAIQDGLEALRSDPASEGVRLDVALSYLRLDRFEECLRVIEDGGETLLEKWLEARTVKSAALRRSGRPEEALQCLQPLLDPAVPFQLQSFDEHVRTLLQLERVDDALGWPQKLDCFE